MALGPACSVGAPERSPGLAATCATAICEPAARNAGVQTSMRDVNHPRSTGDRRTSAERVLVSLCVRAARRYGRSDRMRSAHRHGCRGRLERTDRVRRLHDQWQVVAVARSLISDCHAERVREVRNARHAFGPRGEGTRRELRTVDWCPARVGWLGASLRQGRCKSYGRLPPARSPAARRRAVGTPSPPRLDRAAIARASLHRSSSRQRRQSVLAGTKAHSERPFLAVTDGDGYVVRRTIIVSRAPRVLRHSEPRCSMPPGRRAILRNELRAVNHMQPRVDTAGRKRPATTEHDEPSSRRQGRRDLGCVRGGGRAGGLALVPAAVLS